MSKNIEIIQPDDWHVHFREGDMLEMVTNFSSRINNRCVAMPNTQISITDTDKAIVYKEKEHELAKRFDLICLRLQYALLNDSKSQENGIQTIYNVGVSLYKKRKQ